MHTNFVISQIFMGLFYAVYFFTYRVKNRRLIIILNSLGQVFVICAFFFLNAYLGMLIASIALSRNIVLQILSQRNARKKLDPTKISSSEIIVFCIIICSSLVVAFFTYTSVLGLFSLLGIIIYSFSILQKNILLYRLLGIPGAISWLVYNVYVNNVIGIIFQAVLSIFIAYNYLKLKKELMLIGK